MPGPGLDVVGEEELAKLAVVIPSGRLNRYGPDDDLATRLAVFLPDQATASAMAEQLGSITLDGSGRHVHSHMVNLLQQRTVTGRG